MLMNWQQLLFFFKMRSMKEIHKVLKKIIKFYKII